MPFTPQFPTSCSPGHQLQLEQPPSPASKNLSEVYYLHQNRCGNLLEDESYSLTWRHISGAHPLCLNAIILNVSQCVLHQQHHWSWTCPIGSLCKLFWNQRHTSGKPTLALNEFLSRSGYELDQSLSHGNSTQQACIQHILNGIELIDMTKYQAYLHACNHDFYHSCYSLFRRAVDLLN